MYFCQNTPILKVEAVHLKSFSILFAEVSFTNVLLYTNDCRSFMKFVNFFPQITPDFEKWSRFFSVKKKFLQIFQIMANFFHLKFISIKKKYKIIKHFCPIYLFLIIIHSFILINCASIQVSLPERLGVGRLGKVYSFSAAESRG